ncbi:MAG: hypothetical protein WBX09_13540 [Terracidiphilus sp.]
MRKHLLQLALFALCPLLAAQQAMNNGAVIKLAKAGLPGDPIVSTINAQPGSWDTSAGSGAALMNSGDSAVAAVLARATAPAQAAPTPPPSQSGSAGATAAASNNPKRYTVDYIHSGKKWWRKVGFNASTVKYDDVSELIENKVAATVDLKGFQRGAASDTVCCKLTIELLEVKTHAPLALNPLSKKDSDVEVDAYFTFADGSGRTVYKQEYQGIGPTSNGSGEKDQMMLNAVAELVNSISRDERFNKALTASGANTQ